MFSAFHWPDRVIGKRESRRIREEHNELYNSHAELLAALAEAERFMSGFEDDDSQEPPVAPRLAKIRAAISNAVKPRLEYLRGELRAERISTGELVILQSLAAYIGPGDVELLEAAGVTEEEARKDGRL